MMTPMKLKMMVLEKHGGSYANVNGSTYWIPPDGSRPYHVNIVFLRRMATMKSTYKKEQPVEKKEQLVNAEPIPTSEPVGGVTESKSTGSEETKPIEPKVEKKTGNKESKKKKKDRKKKTISKMEVEKKQDTEVKIEPQVKIEEPKVEAVEPPKEE